MVIICEGTRDRHGYRLILALEKNRVVARKIHFNKWSNPKFWELDLYITDHGYEKVKCILDDSPVIDGTKITFKNSKVKVKE
jgi:hypothetical protein